MHVWEVRFFVQGRGEYAKKFADVLESQRAQSYRWKAHKRSWNNENQFYNSFMHNIAWLKKALSLSYIDCNKKCEFYYRRVSIVLKHDQLNLF